VPFVTRSGGHGWTSTLKGVQEDGVVINVRNMNGVKVDVEKGIAVLGAGALTGEVLNEAYKEKAHVGTP